MSPLSAFLNLVLTLGGCWPLKKAFITGRHLSSLAWTPQRFTVTLTCASPYPSRPISLGLHCPLPPTVQTSSFQKRVMREHGGPLPTPSSPGSVLPGESTRKAPHSIPQSPACCPWLLSGPRWSLMGGFRDPLGVTGWGRRWVVL